MKPYPIVAIVGQPNVGKSTLMNKIAGRSLAITSDVEGTTRDRQYVDTSWNGSTFTLVDTAGLNLTAHGELEHSLHTQIEIALEEADVILLLVDGKQSRSSVDDRVIKKFRKIKKPIALVINKLDSSAHWEEKIGEFQHLGIKNIFPVSALNGRGLGDLLDYLAKTVIPVGKGLDPSLPEDDQPTVQKDEPIAISIVGKPNVGKSSIFNAILKEERVVVSPIPGTTRAAIDSEIKIDGVDYTFIDTAGLKKKAFRQEQPDVFAGFQTFKAIRRSDVCFFVIDATEEITKQDQRVAQEIFALEKGLIILANKCDLLPSSPDTEEGKSRKGSKHGKTLERPADDQYQSTRNYISHHFPFLWMCPLFFVSAKNGENLTEALAAIKPIFDRRHKTVDADVLKELLAKKVKINGPKLLRDQKKPKVFGLNQLETNPPAFELVVNYPAAISTQFRKFIENGIIKDLDFYGTPIKLRLRGKDKT